MAKQKHTNWGFDTAAMDRSVTPAQDFYQYANGNWLKTNVIPGNESRWGSFNILRKETEVQLQTLMKYLLKKRAPKGSDAQLVADYFRSGMDMKRRNKLGAAPLAPFRKLIDDIHDQRSLQINLAKLGVHALNVPWIFVVDQDSKNSSRYVLHFCQSGLGMPDRDYYLKNEKEFVRVKKEYLVYIEKMFKLAGHSPKEAKKAVGVVMDFETRLAKMSMSKIELRDPHKRYNKKSFSEFKRMAPTIDWDTYFKHIEIPKVPYLIVEQPEFLKGAAKLFRTIPIENWRTYLTWHLLISSASALSDKFVKTNFDFYGRVLAGQKEMRPLWRRVLSSVNGSVGFAFGKLYVAKYFSPKAKRAMDTLVSDLFKVYERRMNRLDWMSPATRKKAVTKLRAVSRKIGYPTKWKRYPGLVIKPDDYFGNFIRVSELENERAIKKLKKPVDRTEWFMTPQTVNAYCSFNLNEIVFPAAILQHPFFDLSNDDAVNYGAIGSVIGHEMTHAFDDQGSKFDLKGNLKSWWTASDRKQFEKRAEILVKQYGEFRVADGVSVNGKLTLGENIADLGGLVIAYDAYQEHLKKTGKRKMIDGFTPEQRFFLGYAQQEQELSRPEFQKFAAINDPHSPAEFRINGPVAHVPEFYQAFNVKRGSPLYREPSQRAHIW